MVTPANIAIIGAGNMGSCLLGGLIQEGHPVSKLWVSDRDQEKLDYLQQNFQINITTNNDTAIAQADVVIFAIKPDVFAAVATSLKNQILGRKPLVLSIAAGIREARIQDWLGGDTAIVRAMPNTPALIGCGATALYANGHVNHTQRNLAESIMRAVGLIVWLDDEAQMDCVTALSGSGPAYFFLVMEALEQAAKELGLPEETSHLLTLQTALGAARMAIESGKSLSQLRQNVTSPGGTTEKAVSMLESNNIREIFKKALQAAKSRSEMLGK